MKGLALWAVVYLSWFFVLFALAVLASRHWGFLR